MELSIDTASETASLALSLEGRVAAHITWRCRRNHTAELLPTIDRLLSEAGAAKRDLTAVFVCTGPGTYTGLRVGVSTAKGLAYALGLPVVGIGRLELDAYPHAEMGGAIVPVHQAGRGELAWAVYRAGPWREAAGPRLTKPEELAREAPPDTVFCGEVDEALSALVAKSRTLRVAPGPPDAGRAPSLAVLGYQRLKDGRASEAAAVRPVYLRPPAIGPQST
ncbi:MAG: tRNA (adenosine(37)-N6)-threonylcarbamoyltransferase complex dimerization subunit type 1 TsaB [Chloroflexi bacterium]|nr:tRNA (adenosine(37)-N6)-threonylcarbamoyltransferase complex dimerization subunit type 1 TsaB [Chloroflexota bacterium]